MPAPLKLNLGAGEPPHPEGYISVDRVAAFAPDVVHDLERIPWPWDSDSIAEIRAYHVLEHLGETRAAFLAIMGEFHRVLIPEGIIDIRVPSHRCDNQWGNYTHIRPITHMLLNNFSFANGHMPEIYRETGIDFEIIEAKSFLTAAWDAAVKQGGITEAEVMVASRELWNVIAEERFLLRKVRHD